MGSGKHRPIVTRRKQVLKFGEAKNNFQASAVDPYRQTSMQQSTSYEGSLVTQESNRSTEADTKLKDLINEIHSLSSRNSTEEEPMSTEQTNTDNGANSELSKAGGEPQAEEEITFWKQLTDPNSSHAYYWNPKTNQVSWTLPSNGVIADDTPNEDASIVEADNPFAEYYAYYKQYYGSVEDSSKEGDDQDDSVKGKETTQTASSGSATQGGAGKPSKTKSKDATKKSTESAAEVEAFVGPTLPAPGELSSGETGRPGTKRKASSDEQGGTGEVSAESGLDPASKKPRLKAKSLTASPGAAKKSLLPQSALAEQALRFQVSNMADELTRKLGFLHVTNEGLSDIQLLSIQLQTRLADWKEGGLGSKFMLSKLKTSAVSLQEYEKSAAPDGWKVVWDSSSCRYQYHNLSTGETTWQYPAQVTESTEMSSQEESSDNETAPESPTQEDPLPEPQLVAHTTSNVAASNQLRVVPSKVSSHQPPPASSATPAGRLPVTTSPSNKPAVSNKQPPGDQVSIKESVSPYDGPTKEYVTAGPPPYRHYKSRHSEVPPPPPPPKCELTVDKVREKLYPTLRPRRPSRQSEEPSVTPLLPPVATTEETEEIEEPVLVVNREGMEFISEFPPPSEDVSLQVTASESSQSEPANTTATKIPAPSPSDRKEMSIAAETPTPLGLVTESRKCESIQAVAPVSNLVSVQSAAPVLPSEQIAVSEDSEARMRERLLEKQKNRFRTEPASREELTSLVDSSRQEAPIPTAQDRVEQATGEHDSSQLVEIPSTESEALANSHQQSGMDDSRVEPETGVVETIPNPITDTASQQKMPKPAQIEKILSANQSKAVSQLYQDWTPSPSEGASPLRADPSKDPQSSKDEVVVGKGEEGEVSMESGSSTSSDSASETEGKSASTGKPREEQRKSERSPSKRSSKYDHSDHERYSDNERGSSRRHRSSKRSRRDNSSDESEERHSRRDRHRRSHRDDRDRSYSDDEHSRRRERSSRSSRRSSRKNRSRSRSSRRHRRSRSHSRDSQSPYRSDRGKKKSPKHKKAKKEKRKKHHKSEKDKEKKEDTPKPPPNVIVGKVGRIKSKRTLGQERKLSDEPETPKTPVGTVQSTQQMPQAMSATYYQQPSTGQVPYYNMDSYYQGYYDPSVYQQWGAQGQWYGTRPATSQAASGTVQAGAGTTQYATGASGQYASVANQYSTSTSGAEQYQSTASQAPQYTTASSEAAQSTAVASTQGQYDTSQTGHSLDSVKTADQPVKEANEASVATGPESESADNTAQQESAPSAPSLGSTEVVETVFEETTEEEVVTEVIVETTGSKETANPSDDADSVRVVIEQVVVPESVEEEPVGAAEQNREQSMVEVEMEEEITECDMEIDNNSPSSDTVQSPLAQETIDGQKGSAENEELATQSGLRSKELLTSQSPPPASTTKPEDSVESKKLEEASKPKEDNPPLPPTTTEDTASPDDKQLSLSSQSKVPSDKSEPLSSTNEKPSDKDANTTSEAIKSIESSVPPTASTPPTPPAAGTVTTTPSSTAYSDYSAYMLASQQNQAYNYAYATNNYMQAAYSAYVQQASAAAAYQAYGAQYYPGYGTYGATGSYASPYSTGSGYYGATPSPVTQSPTSGYGKVAFQLAQEQQNATSSTADGGDSKKSEFALAGSKSKQMKNMMTKWSSFKEGEDPSTPNS